MLAPAPPLDDPRLGRRTLWLSLGLSLVLAVLAGVAMLMPGGGARPLIPHLDKAAHALAFFAICLPLAAVLPRAWVWWGSAALAYGAAIELVQPWFGRSMDGWDLAADAAGIALALLVGRALHPRVMDWWARRQP